jgi:hypothetical protein
MKGLRVPLGERRLVAVLGVVDADGDSDHDGIVAPFGCVCQAVRALSVKWTLLALSREDPDGAATVSM